MGTITTLNVSFDSHGYDIPARIAAQHYEALEYEHGTHTFLGDLMRRSGPCRGLTTWGISAKIYGDEYFVRALLPFWRDLLSGPAGDDGDDWPMNHTHVMVIGSDGASAETRVYAIGWDDAEAEGRQLLIHRWQHQPFSWLGAMAGPQPPFMEVSRDGEEWRPCAS